MLDRALRETGLLPSWSCAFSEEEKKTRAPYDKTHSTSGMSPDKTGTPAMNWFNGNMLPLSAS